MSVVIALKFNNGVLLASDRQVTRYGKAIKDQCNKIFQVANSKFAVGGVGTLRESQIMKKIANDLFVGYSELNESNCVSLLNRITPLFRNNLLIESNEIVDSLEGTFIFADAYNINCIGSDLSVLSDLDYYSIGCGEESVMGHLNAVLEKKDPNTLDILDAKKLVEECIKLSCKDDCYIDDNIDYIILYKSAKDIVEDSQYELFDKCELEILNKTKTKSECKKNCSKCKHNVRLIYNKSLKTIEAFYLRG